MEVVITPSADHVDELAATVLLDEAAADELGYYRETYRHKPTWQHL